MNSPDREIAISYMRLLHKLALAPMCILSLCPVLMAAQRPKVSGTVDPEAQA